ncbi:MAG: extracellular solute-binding protein, partial [Lachnospiraceae bacterium]|nr:extracellular solute-binding protein [Lachnospiraceae bacterium]
NEELYNQITLGDSYDLVCPSEYMIMKMMEEDMLTPYSDGFYDKNVEENYYSKNVSPYINDVFKELEFGGSTLDKYAAGYMLGTLGIVYNPEEVSEEEAAHWDILLNDKFRKKITIKDSVRDAFFAGVSIYYYDEITKESFIAKDNYNERLTRKVNSTDKRTVDGVEKILSKIKDNVYAFETDSGKADLVTGKVIANQQWSGDAVYTLDQAEEEGTILCYSVPEEASNIWFDGWVMLKDSVEGDEDKRLAAEAFVNYVSMEENAIRNMMYIGYTSAISGDLVFQYADWCYGADVEAAEEEGEELIEYDVNYFFAKEDGELSDEIEGESGEDEKGDYVITAYADQANRQLFSQYPPLEVMERCAVMAFFDKEDNAYINRMWTNVRCFDLNSLFD